MIALNKSRIERTFILKGCLVVYKNTWYDKILSHMLKNSILLLSMNSVSLWKSFSFALKNLVNFVFLLFHRISWKPEFQSSRRTSFLHRVRHSAFAGKGKLSARLWCKASIQCELGQLWNRFEDLFWRVERGPGLCTLLGRMQVMWMTLLIISSVRRTERLNHTNCHLAKTAFVSTSLYSEPTPPEPWSECQPPLGSCIIQAHARCPLLPFSSIFPRVWHPASFHSAELSGHTAQLAIPRPENKSS